MATYVQIFMSKVYTVFVSLCFVLEAQSTHLNIEELQKSKYGVEILAEPVLLNNESKDGSVMQITSKHGQQYQCVLPIVQFETKEPSIVNVTTEEIKNLLLPLNETCLYLLNGWWSYRVCIGKSIYQYHDQGRQVKDNISLGNFSGDTDWSKVTIKEETSGDKRYHSQFYTNGTLCDLTGMPRNTEVRFFCNSQGSDYISRIDERSTCVYVITIYTNKLCNHSLFRPPPRPQKHSITCSPALVEDQYKKYTEAQQKANEELPVSDNDDIDNDEHNRKRHSPDIVDTLAKMYHKENIKETNDGPQLRTKEEESIDWVDVFKTSKRIIEKSFERAKKLRREKESSQDENDGEEISEDEDDDDTTNDEEDEIYDENEESGSYRKTKQTKAKKKMKININDLGNDFNDEKVDDPMDREDDYGWDVDTMDDLDYSMGNEGSSSPFKKGTLSNLFYNIKKHKKDEKGDYYQDLIERLKMQYEHYKKQLDTMTNDMNKKIKRLEDSDGPASPTVKALVDAIKLSVKSLQDKQRVAEDAMKRLTDLYDAVMEDPDYLNANEELASIRSTLLGLLEKMKSKSDTSETNGDDADNVDYDEGSRKKRQVHKPSMRTEDIFKPDEGRKARDFDMETPKLDKVVSKLKKLVSREIVEDLDSQEDQLDDDRISVRVTKIKEKSEDLYDDKDLEKSFLNEEDEKDEINGNEEIKAATKKMEGIVRKQLEDAGVNHEGKIKVKIITSKEALQRVAGGEEKFQILTPQETNQFKDLLSNLLGGTQELMKEKERQEVLEDNYNLVWNQDGFKSALVNKEQTSVEHKDNDENR